VGFGLLDQACSVENGCFIELRGIHGLRSTSLATIHSAPRDALAKEREYDSRHAYPRFVINGHELLFDQNGAEQEAKADPH
jgi:hypothetical protein